MVQSLSLTWKKKRSKFHTSSMYLDFLKVNNTSVCVVLCFCLLSCRLYHNVYFFLR